MFVEKQFTRCTSPNRRPLRGVGINDANYPIEIKVNNKRYCCPFYKRWSGMIDRCYSADCHERHPTYKDCLVCDEWLTFSNFRAWMKKQDWKGKCLDKDVLIQGNKVYSPETCLFIDENINLLLNTRDAKRGKYKIGVCYHKSSGKFLSRIRKHGQLINLGSYNNEDDAHKAYLKEKRIYIDSFTERQSEPLRSALLNYKLDNQE